MINFEWHEFVESSIEDNIKELDRTYPIDKEYGMCLNNIKTLLEIKSKLNELEEYYD